jgi:hypothetical protein
MTPKQTFDVVQAGYQGDANFQASNGLLNIFVNIPDFSLSDNGVVSVTAGQSQTVTMTVTPASSTPSTVAFSEDSIPPGMSLNFSPSAVNLAGSPATVTVTVSTTGPTGTPATTMTRQVKHAELLGTYKRNWWSIAIASVFAAIHLGIPGRRRRYRGALLAGVLCGVSLAIGCGGGGGGAGGGGGGTGGSGAPVPTSMTLATSNAKLAAGGSFTFTVAVNSTKPVTGTVNIFQGPVGVGSGIAPPIAVVNGKASYTVTNYYAPGTYSFWAQYSGDTNNLSTQTAGSIQEVFIGTTVATFVGQTGGLSHQGRVTINLQ